MRITAVTTGLPGPRKPRLLGFVRVLVAAGHQVSIVSVSDLSQSGPSDRGLPLLAEMGVKVIEVPFAPRRDDLARALGAVAMRRASSEVALYGSRELGERVSAAVEGFAPDVVHVDRVRAVSLVRNLDAPKVVDVTDPKCASYGYYRGAPTLRPLRVGGAEMLRALIDRRPARHEEVHQLRDAPILVASDLGRDALIRAGASESTVLTIPNVVFPTERAHASPPVQPPIVMALSGQLSYPPNILAIDSFARETLPHLRRSLPGARFLVIGAAPHRLVLRIVQRAEGELHSDVDSVPVALTALGVTVAVAPHHVSAGFPNRIVDAIYRAGLPIVVSPETARGTPAALRPHLPVASHPDEWCEQITALGAPSDERPDRIAWLQDLVEAACAPEIIHPLLSAAYSRAMASASASRT